QLGDARVLRAALLLPLEEGGQAAQGGILPSGEQGRTEEVLTAELRRGALSREQFQDDLGLERRREVPSGSTWHQLLLQGPVLLIILVSPKGRSSRFSTGH